jgi:Ca2+-binding RTX toxin-like protein
MNPKSSLIQILKSVPRALTSDTIEAPDVAPDAGDSLGVIFGAGGDDDITLSTVFNYLVLAGDGDDTITEGNDTDRETSTIDNTINGQDGDDDITMGGGDDTILGGDGDDTIRDGAGDDSVEGGDDNDQFFYTFGDSDQYDGGRGYDFIDIDLSGQADGYQFSIDLDGGSLGETGDPSDDVRSIEGVRVIGDADVTVVGDSASNTIDLDAGDDSVDAGFGDDAVYAGEGDDTVNGEEGDDFIEGDLGTNVIDGGDGTDTALYAGAYDDYTVVVDGDGFDVTGTDVSDDVENIELFSFSDQVFTAGMLRIGATNEGDDVGDSSSTDSQELSSGGGDDSVSGGSGSDTVDAGADNDTVDGGAGNDTINGGSGNDSVGGGNGDDEIFDGLGNDTIGGGDGADTGITLSGNNSFVEADETTEATDTSLDDYYAGGYGDDEFFGGGGNDVLVGDRGSAFYFGDDTMTGGTGDDILQGSGGADVFVFRSGDGDDTIGTVDLRTIGSATDITDVLITGADFEVGLDQVDLSDFGFASTADVLALLSDVGGNATLTTSDGTITFYDILSADLGADDFII